MPTELILQHRRACLMIALILSATGACSSSTSPSISPSLPEVVPTAPAPSPRVVRLEDGSYVELSPGVESGFAHCCGDDQYQLEIECSDGLLRCYEQTSNGWEQTYGKYCKATLDTQCYEKTCTRVCEAYWELGETRWHEIMLK